MPKRSRSRESESGYPYFVVEVGRSSLNHLALAKREREGGGGFKFFNNLRSGYCNSGRSKRACMHAKDNTNCQLIDLCCATPQVKMNWYGTLPSWRFYHGHKKLEKGSPDEKRNSNELSYSAINNFI